MKRQGFGARFVRLIIGFLSLPRRARGRALFCRVASINPDRTICKANSEPPMSTSMSMSTSRGMGLDHLRLLLRHRWAKEKREQEGRAKDSSSGQ